MYRLFKLLSITLCLSLSATLAWGADLEGKVICELSARKWEAPRTFLELRSLLQKRYPTARILPFTEFPQGDMVGGIDDDKTAEIVARKGCQAVILGNAG